MTAPSTRPVARRHLAVAVAVAQPLEARYLTTENLTTTGFEAPLALRARTVAM